MEFKKYTKEEVIAAVERGATVYAMSQYYTVIKDKIGYSIRGLNGHTIGLHGLEGTEYENKLNAHTFAIVEKEKPAPEKADRFDPDLMAFLNALKAQGFRVFIADPHPERPRSSRRFYGFYTDESGSRLVDFSHDFLIKAGGNYVTDNPRQCGQGWRIAEDLSFETFLKNAQGFFDAAAPRWATNGLAWRYKTLEEHLRQYQKSSNYVEI